jgi:outer membrane protein assembly factor BamB
VQLEYGREVPLDLREAVPGELPTTTGFVIDGQTVQLGADLRIEDPGVTQQAVPLGDGWLVQGIEGGEPYGWILDAGGEVVDEFFSEAPAHDVATGRTAYVVRTEGGASPVLVVVDADGTELWRTEVPYGHVPLGFDGDEVVVEEWGTNRGPSTIHRLSPDGTFTAIGRVPDDRDGLDPATGRAAWQVDTLPDNTGCFAVTDVATGQPAWERTCQYGLRDFSPDGRFLSAGPAYRSGAGDTGFAVLDATTGEPVVEFTPAQGLQFAVIQSAWEDADSLLVSVQQSDGEGPLEYAVLRLNLDGTVELVSEVLPYSENADFRLTLLHPQAQEQD